MHVSVRMVGEMLGARLIRSKGLPMTLIKKKFSVMIPKIVMAAFRRRRRMTRWIALTDCRPSVRQPKAGYPQKAKHNRLQKPSGAGARRGCRESIYSSLRSRWTFQAKRAMSKDGIPRAAAKVL